MKTKKRETTKMAAAEFFSLFLIIPKIFVKVNRFFNFFYALASDGKIANWNVLFVSVANKISI